MYWILEKEEILQSALARLFHGSSQSTMKSWLTYGLIRVNGRVVKQLDIMIKAGSVLERTEPRKWIGRDLRVVYADQHIIIIDKPAGLLSVATDKGDKQDLFNILKKQLSCDVYVLHRLDRETSGLICFALSLEAYDSLKEQLHDHRMQRFYMAIVQGKVQPEEGAWHIWMMEKADYTMRLCEPGDGEEAISFYRTMASDANLSLLDVQLATGKKHQIRLGCAQAGCPIIGDERYGAKKAPKLALHAYMLSLYHPIKDETLEFYSPSMHQFEAYWRASMKDQAALIRNADQFQERRNDSHLDQTRFKKTDNYKGRTKNKTRKKD
jgi:23S rRNA pseudouridine1911/1915/1917 synthase